MDEQLFWRRMNPARLHALYDAAFALERTGRRAPAPPVTPERPREKKSLYEYLTGG